MVTYLSGAGVALAVLLAQSSTPARQAAWTSFPDRFSHRLGNCEACKPGEAMAMSVITIPHSNYVDINSPPCADPSMMQPMLSSDMRSVVAKSFYGQVGKTALFALGMTDTPKGMAAADPRAGKVYSWAILRRAARLHQTSSCGRNVVVVPKIAAVTRVEPSMNCPAGGWCEHQFKPYEEDLDDNLRVFTIVGKNWSHDTGATTTLRVFYQR